MASLFLTVDFVTTVLKLILNATSIIDGVSHIVGSPFSINLDRTNDEWIMIHLVYT